MSDTSKIDQFFKYLSAETGRSVDELKAMTRKDFEQLRQEAQEAMMDAERNLFALKAAHNSNARADGTESEVFSVPSFIVTEWDEDGEPNGYTPIDKCSPEQIHGHVANLRGKIRTMEEEIANLLRYASAEHVQLVDNDTD